jgi:hypothetical protein
LAAQLPGNISELAHSTRVSSLRSASLCGERQGLASAGALRIHALSTLTMIRLLKHQLLSTCHKTTCSMPAKKVNYPWILLLPVHKQVRDTVFFGDGTMMCEGQVGRTPAGSTRQQQELQQGAKACVGQPESMTQARASRRAADSRLQHALARAGSQGNCRLHSSHQTSINSHEAGGRGASLACAPLRPWAALCTRQRPQTHRRPVTPPCRPTPPAHGT